VDSGYAILCLSRLPARHREPLRRGGRGKPLPQKLLVVGTGFDGLRALRLEGWSIEHRAWSMG